MHYKKRVVATKQVFPGGWTAILISLDNVGSWNLRAENLDRWYLGQETYLKIVNPEENGDTEMAAPDNVLYCGPLKSLQKYIIFLMLHWHCFSPFCLLSLNFDFTCRTHSTFSAASTLGHSLNLFSLLLGLFAIILFLAR